MTRVCIALGGLKQAERDLFLNRKIISNEMANKGIINAIERIIKYQIVVNIDDNYYICKDKNKAPSTLTSPRSIEDVLLDKCEEFIKIKELDDH